MTTITSFTHGKSKWEVVEGRNGKPKLVDVTPVPKPFVSGEMTIKDLAEHVKDGDELYVKVTIDENDGMSAPLLIGLAGNSYWHDGDEIITILTLADAQRALEASHDNG